MFPQKRRIFDRVDVRFLSYLLLGVVITFYVLALTGCLSTSPGIPNLFLVQLHINQSDWMQVGIGYYGMCASQAPGGGFKCLPSYSLGKSKLNDLLPESNSTTDAEYVSDMTMLLSVGHVFQTRIFYPLLAASAGLFFLSVISMLLLKRYMKSMVQSAQPKTKRFRSAMAISRQYAFGLAVAAAFSTTQAAGALNFATTALPDSTPGVTIVAGVPVQGLQ